MTTTVEDSKKLLLDKVKELPPNILVEVIQFVDILTKAETMNGKPLPRSNLQETLSSLRGRGKGEQLVDHLLLSRSEDSSEPKLWP